MDLNQQTSPEPEHGLTTSDAEVGQVLPNKAVSLKRWDIILPIASIVALGILGAIVWHVWGIQKKNQSQSPDKSQSINLSGISSASSSFQVSDSNKVGINGLLSANQGLVIQPGSQPTAPQTGQLYVDSATGQLRYYNGQQFVAVGGANTPNTNNITNVTNVFATGVNSLQGLAGTLTLSSSNGLTVTSGSGNIQINLPQSLSTASNPTFAGLTIDNVSGANLQSGTGQDLVFSSGNSDIIFTSGGRTFIFPTSGGASQTICTTGISCAAGGGQAVILAPGSAQTNASNSAADSSIFINNTGTAQLLQLQGSGTDVLTVSSSGDTMIAGDLTVNNITPSSSLTIGATGQSFTLQGSSTSSFTAHNGANSTTLLFGSITSDEAITIPNETGTVCTTYGSVACTSVYALSSGSNAYIQNQFASPQTADFLISGTGQANTALLTPTLDTATAVTLNIGTTTASSIVIGSTNPAVTTTIRGPAGINIGTGLTQLVNIQTASDIATAFQIQDANGVQILAAGTLPTPNLIDGGNMELNAEVAGWTAKVGATILRNTTYKYLGESSMSVTTTAAANSGAQYSYAFTNGQTYSFALFGRLDSGTFTDFRIGHTDSGTDVDCTVPSFVGSSVNFTMYTGGWYKYECTFTASNTTAIYVKQDGSALVRTFYIDNVSLQQSGIGTHSAASGMISLNGQFTSPILIQPLEDSTSAFHVMASNGYNILDVDTLNQSVSISSSLGDALNIVSTAGNGITSVVTSDNTYALNAVSLVNGGGVNANGSDLPGVNASAQSSYSGLFQTTNSSGTNSNATLVTRANTSQTADLFQAQNSSNNALMAIDINGDIQFRSVSSPSTAHTISVATQTASNTAGKNLSITPGMGNGSGVGGTLTLQGGTAGTTGNVNGGDVNINGGNGNNFGNGGSVNLSGADVGTIGGGNLTVFGAGVGGGGGVTVSGGHSAASDGGDVSILGGNATAGTDNGGDVGIVGGSSAGGSIGNILLQSPFGIDWGNVGVGGLSSVTARLHVSSATSSLDLFKVTDATATARDVFTILDGGAVNLRNQTNSANAFRIQNAAGTQLLNLSSSSGLLTLNNLGTADNATYVCLNSSNQFATCQSTGTGTAFIQGGNSFGATGTLGTNDSNSLAFETNNVTRLTLDTSGNMTLAAATSGGPITHTLSVSQAASNTSGDHLTIAAGAANGSAQTGGNLNLRGGAGGTGNSPGGGITIVAADGTGLGGGGAIEIDAGDLNAGAEGAELDINPGSLFGAGSFQLQGGDSNAGTTGGAGTIRGGNSTTGIGGAVTVQGGSAGGANAGGLATLQGGTAGATGTGGGVAITGGTGGATSGAGGNVTITSGTSTSGATGNVAISTSNATSGVAGEITITGGNGSNGLQAGGNVVLTAGSAGQFGGSLLHVGAGSVIGPGGLTIQGGSRLSGNGVGGQIAISGGSGLGSGNGAAVTVQGGTAGATGAGGVLNLNGGTGGATSGNGGDVSIQGGTVTSGTAGAINIGTSSASALSLQANTSATISVGTTNANTVNIGSTTASTTVAIQGGTGASAITLIPANAGSIIIGATAQTGAITIGQSTATQTINIGTGATGSGNTLSIHIGDNGAAGSTTNITVGSAIAGTLTVQSAAVFNKTLTVGGHVIGANTSGTTTVAAGAAACTSPTVNVSGNDTSGKVTITTGTGCASGGVMATVTFANAYGAGPRVILTPAETNGATLQYFNGTANTTTFTINTNTTPTDATTYEYNYIVIQ